MRVAAALLLALAAAAPALATGGEPDVRDCSTRAIGDLGPTWRTRAVLAGPLAFVGMRNGSGWSGGRLHKVLVVVDPRAVVTVTIAPRSAGVASLAFSTRRRLPAAPVPVSAGATSVRFEACARANPGQKPWNRGTQFPGSFVVARPACVDVVVQYGETRLTRKLRFGTPRCRG